MQGLHAVMAAAMLERDVNLGHFNEARVNDAHLKPARAKVNVVVHDDWPAGTMQSPSRLVMESTDRREFSKDRMYPIGSPHEPLAMQQIRGLYGKFTQGMLTAAQIDSSADFILNLETLDDIQPLMDVLTLARR